MDATYKDTLIGQLSGNAPLDYRDADELIKLIRNKSEGFAKGLLTGGKSRFFYTAKTEDIINKIKSTLTPSELRGGQRSANKNAREGVWDSKVFETTYTKSGHKYVNGRREY